MASRISRLALIAVFFMLAFSASAFAQWDDEDENPFYFGFEGGFFNRAMWRGHVLSDSVNFQPNLWLGNGAFEFNTHGYMDLQDVNNQQFEFNRIDLSLEYKHSFSMLDMSAGGIYYLNPANNDRNTGEAFVGVGFPSLTFEPSLTMYWDFQEVEGYYYDLGVEGTLGGTDDIAGMDWNAHLGYSTGGYQNFYFGDATSNFGAGLNDFRLEASRKFEFGSWYLKPVAGFSMLIDNEIRDVAADQDNFWLGVYAGFEV